MGRWDLGGRDDETKSWGLTSTVAYSPELLYRGESRGGRGLNVDCVE